jgi:putative Mn2+ efflux pump MntP
MATLNLLDTNDKSDHTAEMVTELNHMNLFEIVPIALGLAMDAFSVSLASGSSITASNPRALFRLSFHFGLFQFMMPVMGWFIGMTVAPYAAAVDHWIAFGLLALVGIRMIRSGFGSGPGAKNTDPSRGLTLIMLSLATSIDAFAIGLSLAFLRIEIWYPSILIGLITMILSLIGLGIGHRLGLVFGRRMEIVGGILLFLIGIHILVSHLYA